MVTNADRFQHIDVGSELDEAEWEGTTTHAAPNQAAGDFLVAEDDTKWRVGHKTSNPSKLFADVGSGQAHYNGEILTHDLRLGDGQYLWFGNDKDKYIRYNSTTGLLEENIGISGLDLHEDVPTKIATISETDRLLISDESATGEPNRYTEASDLSDYVVSRAAGDGIEVASGRLRVDLDGTSITRGSSGIKVTTPNPALTASDASKYVQVNSTGTGLQLATISASDSFPTTETTALANADEFWVEKSNGDDRYVTKQVLDLLVSPHHFGLDALTGFTFTSTAPIGHIIPNAAQVIFLETSKFVFIGPKANDAVSTLQVQAMLMRGRRIRFRKDNSNYVDITLIGVGTAQGIVYGLLDHIEKVGSIADNDAISIADEGVALDYANIVQSVPTSNTNWANIPSETGVRAAITAMPQWSGTWTASTSYQAGDIVERSSDIYLCKTANSDSTFAASNWYNLTEDAVDIGALTVKTNAPSSTDNLILESGGTNYSWTFGRLVANIPDQSTLVTANGEMKIADGGVDTTQLAADGVTLSKLAGGTDSTDDNKLFLLDDSADPAWAKLLAKNITATNSPSDGQVMTYDSGTGGWTWEAKASGGGNSDPFDLHDDVTTQMTAAADTDRLVASDESATGDPNTYLELQTLANYIAAKIDGDGLETSSNTLRVKLDGSTLARSSSGMKVNSIGTAEIASTAIGDGLEVSSNALRVKLKSSSGIERTSSGIAIDYGDGLEVASDALRVKLQSSSAIERASGGLAVNTGDGLEINSDALRAKLDGTTLARSSSGLKVNSIGTAEIASTAVGDGLEVSSNALRVDLDGTSITRGSSGIKVTDPNPTPTSSDASKYVQVNSAGDGYQLATVTGGGGGDASALRYAHSAPTDGTHSTTTSYTDLFSITIDNLTTSSVVYLLLTGSWAYSLVGEEISIKIVRSSTDINEADAFIQEGANKEQALAFAGVDTGPAAGSNTYKFQIKADANAGTITYEGMQIVAIDLTSGGATAHGISVQATTPSSPTTDDLWVDDTTNPPVFKVYDGSAWQTIGAAGTFDIHDDLSTELTALAGTDRFAVSDESASGDPTKYITATNVKSLMTAEFVGENAAQATLASGGIRLGDREYQTSISGVAGDMKMSTSTISNVHYFYVTHGDVEESNMWSDMRTGDVFYIGDSTYSNYITGRITGNRAQYSVTYRYPYEVLQSKGSLSASSTYQVRVHLMGWERHTAIPNHSLNGLALYNHEIGSDQIRGGYVTGCTVSGTGSGYTSASTITFGAPDDVGGVTATGTLIISSGDITGVRMTNQGSGYLRSPSVTLGSPGSGKTVVANVASAEIFPSQLRVFEKYAATQSSNYSGDSESIRCSVQLKPRSYPATYEIWVDMYARVDNPGTYFYVRLKRNSSNAISNSTQLADFPIGDGIGALQYQYWSGARYVPTQTSANFPSVSRQYH